MALAKPDAMSLDRLIALNDEMAALVRAGVPLDQGLMQMGQELPGGLGKLAGDLGARLNDGESLEDVLDDRAIKLPPVWRAVIAAGLRTGRLSAALEGLSTTARRVAELRRSVGLALVYPVVVLAMAYGVFVLYVTKLAPVWDEVYEDLTASSNRFIGAMTWLGETAPAWLVAVPLILIASFTVWWLRSGSASQLDSGVNWPSVGRAMRDGRRATFTELLALLIRQQVPMQEAVVLAADASGDRGMRKAARELAERLERGEVITRRDELPEGFPPLLGWLVATGAMHRGLPETLMLTAQGYRQRVDRAVAWNAIYLPLVLTAVIGGGATLFQALIVFGPIIQLWHDLG